MTELDLDAIRARWNSHRNVHAASFPPAWRCCSGCRIAYDETPRLVAEVERLQALVAEYEGDNRHVIEFRDDGWTIMHPIACRPDLFGCEVNRVTSDQISGPPEQGLGRYYCHLDQGELVLDERVQAATAQTEVRS